MILATVKMTLRGSFSFPAESAAGPKPSRAHAKFCYHGEVARVSRASSRSCHSWPFLLLAVAGCASPTPSAGPWSLSPALDLGPAVAQVDQTPIFAGQVLAEAKRTGQSPRAALTALIDEQVIARAAAVRGWPRLADADSERAMVERLLERDLEPVLGMDKMPDKTLRHLYDAARDAFVHPRLVDVGVLAVYTGARMPADMRKVREQTASELSAYLARHPAASLDEFANVAHDKQWSDRLVVYGRFLQGTDKPLSPIIGKEVAKLKRPGETTPLLSDSNGFFIIRYAGEKPAENTTFAEARHRLAAAYLERWRQEQFLSFSNDLLQRHRVEVHFDRIATDY